MLKSRAMKANSHHSWNTDLASRKHITFECKCLLDVGKGHRQPSVA